MFTATMEYIFKDNKLVEAGEIWENDVLVLAKKQPGFVRMQFLTGADGKRALAIGTWEDKSNAEAFMQTGVFKDLMEKIKDTLEEDPKPLIWDLKYYAEK